ncbi:MAG TPA: YtxH domain-containing protein [Ktedonobacteraceae bacterium]|nr:YtxH domain-containing protein [Ktedonobacteraceae bacterium]
MKRFMIGLLIGAGIGLLIAPVTGEEMRRLLAERIQEMRGYLPENVPLNEYVSQVSDRVSQTGSNLRGYAQQATSMVKDTGSNLGDLARRAADEVKQTGKDMAVTTRQTARSE